MISLFPIALLVSIFHSSFLYGSFEIVLKVSSLVSLIIESFSSRDFYNNPKEDKRYEMKDNDERRFTGARINFSSLHDFSLLYS